MLCFNFGSPFNFRPGSDALNGPDHDNSLKHHRLLEDIVYTLYYVQGGHPEETLTPSISVLACDERYPVLDKNFLMRSQVSFFVINDLAEVLARMDTGTFVWFLEQNGDGEIAMLERIATQARRSGYPAAIIGPTTEKSTDGSFVHENQEVLEMLNNYEAFGLSAEADVETTQENNFWKDLSFYWRKVAFKIRL
jgi:hypothetical protein